MKTPITGGALALLAALAVPALAQDGGDPIVVQTPLIHPAAGLMNEHMHEGGEWMLGLRFERTHAGGTNQSGTHDVADPAIVAAGYGARATSMTMDMAMLDLMYAPTDNLTLMVMPQYMWHRMEMVGINPAGVSHGGHSLAYGETMAHATDGLGDTLFSASYRLVRRPGFGAHVTLGVWAPTGAVDKKDHEGNFVHYGMQPGSGTWDLEPQLTVTGRAGPLGWGGQASYRWRTEEHNASGFAFGDKARATGWVGTLLGRGVGATGRFEYVHEGQVLGHYNAGHNHLAPPDRQQNYGGDVVSAGIGLNWLLPVGSASKPQLSGELSVPLYQDLNGIQAPQDWRFTLGLSQTF
ncbi:MAG TPA: hypothetical protein VFS49_11045 [Croceibacterium sp.]|nr:hypothetical protein [Croceibacterium sp.]